MGCLELEQLLETWMQWPFEPMFADLLGTNSGTAWGEDLDEENHFRVPISPDADD